MNITVNTAQLAKKLRLVEKIVPQKSLLPILSNVLIRADLNEMSLSTTNMEVSLTTTCPVTVNAPGRITAPVKPLLDIVNQISEEQMHFILEKGHVRIAAGSFKMRLQTLSADDFPPLPTMPQGGMLIPGDVFKTMIGRVRYAISDSDKRYFLNGALLSLTENLIALVATDGKRLALTATKRTTPGDAVELVVPTKTLDVLLSDEGHEDILFHRDARQMFFVSDDNILTSRMIDGTFPNYKRIIPQSPETSIELPRLPLIAALKRVGLASNDAGGITLTFNDNAVSLSSANAQVGDAHEMLAITYAGDALKLTFEWNFILDFLNASASAVVKLELKKDVSSSLWRDSPEFINVIMQMRT